MMDENFHALSILVELDLYKRIRAIREGNFPNGKEMRANDIDSFEKGLPDYLSELEGSHEFIINKVKSIDQEIKRINSEKNKVKI